MSDITYYHGYQIEVDVDPEPQDPRSESCNLGTMICFHRRYDLGDKHTFASPQDVLESLGATDDTDGARRHPNEVLGDGSAHRIVWLPIYLYDHSGLAMQTTPFTCPWDSGQVGMIFISYDTIRLEVEGVRTGGPYTPDAATIEKYTAILKAEVQTYHMYLSGEVYGYTIKRADGEAVDDGSVWEFYGRDAAIEEAKRDIDNRIANDPRVGLESDTRVVVEFDVTRLDLEGLYTSGEYGKLLDVDVADASTQQLMIALLQHILYDSEDGPQLAGNYAVTVPQTEG